MPTKKVALHVRILPNLKGRLAAEAERRGISESALVAVILDRHLPKERQA